MANGSDWSESHRRHASQAPWWGPFLVCLGFGVPGWVGPGGVAVGALDAAVFGCAGVIVVSSVVEGT